MQKSFIVLYFCFHVTIILFHATFFSLYSVAASSTISVCPTEAYHFIEANNMIIDHFIEANKMARVGTHPTFVYAKIFCLSVCPLTSLNKECRFATALNDTDKKILE